LARKTIRVSDQSGSEIPDGKGATVRITFADARKGVRELDLTDAEAERLGTYPISILPDEDCCTLFTPRHPATRASLADVVAAEKALPVADMVAAAALRAGVEEFRFPVLRYAVAEG